MSCLPNGMPIWPFSRDQKAVSHDGSRRRVVRRTNVFRNCPTITQDYYDMPERRSMTVDFLRVSALIGSHLTSSLGDKDGPMLPFAAHHWTLGNAANSEGSIAFHHNTAQLVSPH